MTTPLLPKPRSGVWLVLLAYLAFISLGLPDGLLGVAWPTMRTTFGQPLDALGILLLASTSGYLVSSFFSGRLIAWLGVGGLLSASCGATGASLIGFTISPSWWGIVFLGIVAGVGAGAIDAGINTYVASEHSQGLMQWLHASFGIGITLGPIIMTTGLNTTHSWRTGYLVVGAAQIGLAACFALTASLWKQPGSLQRADENQRIIDYRTPMWETLSTPRVWLSLGLFFVYTGLELTLGHWVYTLLTESRGIAGQVAGLWAGSYWAMFTLGRILAGVYTRRIGLHTLVRASLLAALAGVSLLWWNPSHAASLAGVAIVGFAIAPIFPAMVSGTSGRVGAHHSANTIGMQVSAAGLGGAILPGLAGVLAQSISLEVIPAFLASLVVILLGLYSFATLVPQTQSTDFTDIKNQCV